LPNPGTYQLTDSLEPVKLKDTVYGIENEDLIPVRYTEVPLKKDVLINKLYDPSPLKEGIENWQIVIVVIVALLLGMVKAFSHNRFRLGLKALLNYGVAQEIIREEQVFFHRSNVLLTLAHTLTLSLFVYQIKMMVLNGTTDSEGFSSFLIIVTGIVIVYSVKYVFARLLSFIFNDLAIVSEYIFNVSLYNNLLGVLLTPFLLVSYFTIFPFQTLLNYMVVPLVLLVFLFRLIRLFIIGRSRGVLYVYIFLYICTLEILPLVVLYRIFVH